MLLGGMSERGGRNVRGTRMSDSVAACQRMHPSNFWNRALVMPHSLSACIRTLIHQEPTLRLVSVQLKYAPWREALMAAWRSGVRALPGGGKSLQQATANVRARFFVKVLRDMCANMVGMDDQAWVASLGHSVSHVSGPLATLNRLGILRPTSKQGLALGMGKGSRRRLCSGVRELRAAAAKLGAYSKLSQETSVPKAPRTYQDWVDEHFRLDAIFTEHKVFPPKKHLRKCVIRGLLLASMARDGVRGLTGADSISTTAFCKTCPDSKWWIAKLVQKGSSRKLRDFCDSIGYTGEVELLTGFTCLLFAKVVRKHPGWLQKHGRSLRRSMEVHFATGGWYMLPALWVWE